MSDEDLDQDDSGETELPPDYTVEFDGGVDTHGYGAAVTCERLGAVIVRTMSDGSIFALVPNGDHFSWWNVTDSPKSAKVLSIKRGGKSE